MKTLNLDQMQREQPVIINRATVTLMDRRTGKIENRDFYRAGPAFPVASIRKELDSYGFDIIGTQESAYVEGTIDLELLYASMDGAEGPA